MSGWHVKTQRNWHVLELVGLCLEPSQPEKITPGLKSSFILSRSYSLDKLSNVSHTNLSFKQLFKSTSHKQFLDTLHILWTTPISRRTDITIMATGRKTPSYLLTSLSQEVNFFISESRSERVNTKISLQNISFWSPAGQNTQSRYV